MKARRPRRQQAGLQAYLRSLTRQPRNNESAIKLYPMDEADAQLRHELIQATAINPLTDGEVAPFMDLNIGQGPVEALRGALINGRFSDLIISCGEQKFKAHRVITCSQSKVFEEICAESEFSGIIDLHGHSSDAVVKMVEFFYTGSYSTIDVEPDFCLPLHTRVYGLAVEYQIQGLITLSAKKFAGALCQVSDLEVYFQSIRDVYGLLVQRENASLHPDATNYVSAQSYLRAEVVNTALIEFPKFVSSPPVLSRLQEVCSEVPQFLADFLSALSEIKVGAESLVESQTLCKSCGPMDDAYEIKIQ